jgi:hypothetical protein
VPTPVPADARTVAAPVPRRWPEAQLLRQCSRSRSWSVRAAAAAADPGGRAPRRAPALGGARPRRGAAAGSARRRLTRARSRAPPAPRSPSVRGPGGAGSGPHLTDLPSPCRALRRALHSAHRNDATPHRDDAMPGRTPGRVAGARKGVFTAYVLDVAEAFRIKERKIRLVEALMVALPVRASATLRPAARPVTRARLLAGDRSGVGPGRACL